MSRRRVLAWSLWAAGLIAVALGAVQTVENVWILASLGLGGLAFGLVGLVLAGRTRFVTGWLFLAIQISTGPSSLAGPVRGPSSSC